MGRNPVIGFILGAIACSCSNSASTGVGGSGADGLSTADVAELGDAKGQDLVLGADLGTTADVGPSDLTIGNDGQVAPADATAPSDATAPADIEADAQADLGSQGLDTQTDLGPTKADCGVCPIGQAPTGPQPGSSFYGYEVDIVETVFGPAKRNVLMYTPKGPGPFPVIGFVHGKLLYEGAATIGQNQLGRSYRPLLEHVARKGYIVVFVRVENDLFDSDHVRMADDFLGAFEAAIVSSPTADPTRVAYAGHSMGGKVVLIAAAKATALDTQKAFHDPTLVMAMAPDNSAPPMGTYVDARNFIKQYPMDTLWVTYLAGNQDTIAPWNDPKLPDSKAMYDVTPAKGKQLVLLHGSGPDDALNPPTTPKLVADHMFPGAIEGLNGGLSDAATPASHLDALDWYGVWKMLVGAADYHFKAGDPVWAYGALRTHGGTLPDGSVFAHTVEAQALPPELGTP